MRHFDPKTMTEAIPGMHKLEGTKELPDDNWFFTAETIPEGEKLATNNAGEPILVTIIQ